MDENQRKLIIKNVDRLVNLTDFDKLSKACLSTAILSQVMLKNIYLAEPLEIERHKKLFEKITKRGPNAYDTLRRILVDLNYNEALAILNDYDDSRMISISESKVRGIPTATPSVIQNSQSYNNNNEEVDQGPQKIDEYYGEINPKEKITVKKSLRICKHPSIETYPMESKDNRGVFFMVNIIDFPNKDEQRKGADEDANSLLYLFREMGFKLFSYTNLTQTDFWKRLEELLDSEYTKHTECFVMALMTHGNMDDGVQRITFGDGSVVKVNEIEQRFYHHICTNLIHKPKIFLFPFCRGDMREKGVNKKRIQTDSINYSEPRTNNIAHLSDVCICYATSEGFKAHRDPEDGSWYIQSFVKNMADLAHDTAFEDILKKIQAETAKLRTDEGHLQTANYVNKSFNKALYFNPGAHKE